MANELNAARGLGLDNGNGTFTYLAPSADEDVRVEFPDRNCWFPGVSRTTTDTRINSDTLMPTGIAAPVLGGARYYVEAVLSLQRTNGSVAVYFSLEMPNGSDGQVVYQLPIATTWGAKDVNVDSGNIGSLSVATREILTLRGWVRAGADGNATLKMRINATDLGVSDFYDVKADSMLIMQRIS